MCHDSFRSCGQRSRDSALEDLIRVVGVAELVLILPYVTGAHEIMAQGDVHQQICLLLHSDVADFEIGMAVALTREHPLVIGGETGGVTNALQCPQDMVVCIGPIRSMMDAGADVVPGEERESCLLVLNSVTSTPKKILF
jgi:hypothetical protein